MSVGRGSRNSWFRYRLRLEIATSCGWLKVSLRVASNVSSPVPSTEVNVEGALTWVGMTQSGSTQGIPRWQQSFLRSSVHLTARIARSKRDAGVLNIGKSN